MDRETKKHRNALLRLKGCFWSGSMSPLRAQVESPAPEEFAEFETGGTDWFEGVYPPDLENVTEIALAAAKGAEREPLEYRIVTEKRGIVWVRHWFSAGETEELREFGDGLEGFVQVLDEQKHLEAECLRICEREKTVMGQELHDDVCQLLAGLACMLEVIGQKAKTAMPELTPTFKDLAAQLNDGMERTRSLAHSLVPLRLVNMGLARALRELASQTKRNFKVRVDATLPRSIPAHAPDQILQLYRICQEAIGNAIKHGKATAIKIELTRQRNKMNLTIRDNGTGIPAETSRRQGIGLHVMRYRAGAMGGKFAISSLPGKGSTVIVTYDCAGSAQRAQRGVS